jgi:hypothetical protein
MRNKQRQATIDWIAQTDWELAVTLTFRYDITEARARKTLRRWWNEIDKYFYGNAVKRQAKRTKRACLIEKCKSGTNYHYHIHAKRPEDRDISLKKYMQMLELRWKRLSTAGYVNEFEPNTNNIAWATYTTKEITATNTDALDLSASNFEFVAI